jgi:hypothetical protein
VIEVNCGHVCGFEGRVGGFCPRVRRGLSLTKLGVTPHRFPNAEPA